MRPVRARKRISYECWRKRRYVACAVRRRSARKRCKTQAQARNGESGGSFRPRADVRHQTLSPPARPAAQPSRASRRLPPTVLLK
jgi:hypothetical protein